MTLNLHVCNVNFNVNLIKSVRLIDHYWCQSGIHLTRIFFISWDTIVVFTLFISIRWHFLMSECYKYFYRLIYHHLIFSFIMNFQSKFYIFVSWFLQSFLYLRYIFMYDVINSKQCWLLLQFVHGVVTCQTKIDFFHLLLRRRQTN